MTNQVDSTAKRQDSIFESYMTAFPFSAAFTLPGLFEYPYILLIAIISIVVCACILLAFFVHRRKAKRKLIDSTVQENQPKPKPKGIPVTKVEVIDNTVKFFVAKGFLKKRWVAIKEIPVYEITSVENFGNELSVTWKGVTDTFFMKEKAESLGKLRDEVNRILEEHQKSLENNEKATLRRNELLGVINASIGIIDSSFDVLIGLQAKRINWQQVEDHSKAFGENLSFTGQTMPQLEPGLFKCLYSHKKAGSQRNFKGSL